MKEMSVQEALKIIETELPRCKDPYGCTEGDNRGEIMWCLGKSCQWADAMDVIRKALKDTNKEL